MKRLSLKRLAENLKNKREEKKITQKQLSELTGINRAMISRIEKEEYIPSILQLEKLADELDFEFDTLFIDPERPKVHTAFRATNMSEKSQKDIEHLLHMMDTAKDQILLRKRLKND